MLKSCFVRSIRFTVLLGVLFLGSACQNKRAAGAESSSEGSSNVFNAEKGDIVVSNGGSDSVLLLDSEGNFKDILLNVDNTAESVYGITYSADTDEVVVAVDGSDRLLAVSLDDGSQRNLVTSSLFSGVLRGITQLLGGDFLAIEGNALERFNSLGTRITVGGWPKSLQSNPSEVFPLADGGFGMCSYGTRVVRTYDEDGTQTANRASGIAGTVNSYGCTSLSTGQIAVTWNGTSDTVQILSSDLTTVDASFSDTGLLGSPQGVSEDINGDLLVVDSSYHHIVKVSSEGEFIGTLGGAILNIPRSILVIPQ